MGAFRAQFLLESVRALKQNLAGQGSDLVVRIGKPEFIINQIASDYKISAVYTAREVTFDEVFIMGKMEHGLNQLSVSLKQFWTSTLIHDEDIPWPIAWFESQLIDYDPCSMAQLGLCGGRGQ